MFIGGEYGAGRIIGAISGRPFSSSVFDWILGAWSTPLPITLPIPLERENMFGFFRFHEFHADSCPINLQCLVLPKNRRNRCPREINYFGRTAAKKSTSRACYKARPERGIQDGWIEEVAAFLSCTLYIPTNGIAPAFQRISKFFVFCGQLCSEFSLTQGPFVTICAASSWRKDGTRNNCFSTWEL